MCRCETKRVRLRQLSGSRLRGVAMEERRRWARLALAIPVFVRGSDRKGNEFLELGTILNISAGGVLLGLRRLLQRGAHVSLEIPAAFPAVTLTGSKRKFRARIVRAGGRNHFCRYAARLQSPIG